MILNRLFINTSIIDDKIKFEIMKDNRRGFIKKGSSLAAALSLGGISAIAGVSPNLHAGQNIKSSKRAGHEIDYTKEPFTDHI